MFSFPSNLRSQRFHRWSPPLYVPTKTIKSPNFTLRNKEKKRARVYRHPSPFHHIQDNIKKNKRKNGKQKQKQSNQPAAAPTA